MIYEYRCNACEHEFEKEHRITEQPKFLCPECSSSCTMRVISKTSFILIGNHWAKDGYSSGGSK